MRFQDLASFKQVLEDLTGLVRAWAECRVWLVAGALGPVGWQLPRPPRPACRAKLQPFTRCHAPRPARLVVLLHLLQAMRSVYVATFAGEEYRVVTLRDPKESFKRLLQRMHVRRREPAGGRGGR